MFVVVEILEVAPLNNLFAIKVSDGTREFKIVSAAKNLKVGMKTIVATVGSVIDDEELVVKNINGVKSEGMVCDNKALGWGSTNQSLAVNADSLEIGQEAPKTNPRSTVKQAEVSQKELDKIAKKQAAKEKRAKKAAEKAKAAE